MTIRQFASGGGADLAAHESDTTSVHGITDTSALETATGATTKVTAHVNARHLHKDTGFVTTGDISATSGAFAAVGPDLTLPAAAGDVLVLEPDVLCIGAGADTQFEAATRVSGANNRWWSSGTTTSRWPGGLAGWYVETGSQKPGTAERYTVNADDVVSGQVTVRLYARSTGATRTVKADANYPARWALYNVGPAAS